MFGPGLTVDAAGFLPGFVTQAAMAFCRRRCSSRPSCGMAFYIIGIRPPAEIQTWKRTKEVRHEE
jgi:hypothetical protein